MVSQTNEQALESTIEKYLTGTCLEVIKANSTSVNQIKDTEQPFVFNHGY